MSFESEAASAVLRSDSESSISNRDVEECPSSMSIISDEERDAEYARGQASYFHFIPLISFFLLSSLHFVSVYERNHQYAKTEFLLGPSALILCCIGALSSFLLWLAIRKYLKLRYKHIPSMILFLLHVILTAGPIVALSILATSEILAMLVTFVLCLTAGASAWSAAELGNSRCTNASFAACVQIPFAIVEILVCARDWYDASSLPEWIIKSHDGFVLATATLILCGCIITPALDGKKAANAKSAAVLVLLAAGCVVISVLSAESVPTWIYHQIASGSVALLALLHTRIGQRVLASLEMRGDPKTDSLYAAIAHLFLLSTAIVPASALTLHFSGESKLSGAFVWKSAALGVTFISGVLYWGLCSWKLNAASLRSHMLRYTLKFIYFVCIIVPCFAVMVYAVEVVSANSPSSAICSNETSYWFVNKVGDGKHSGQRRLCLKLNTEPPSALIDLKPLLCGLSAVISLLFAVVMTSVVNAVQHRRIKGASETAHAFHGKEKALLLAITWLVLVPGFGIAFTGVLGGILFEIGVHEFAAQQSLLMDIALGGTSFGFLTIAFGVTFLRKQNVKGLPQRIATIIILFGGALPFCIWLVQRLDLPWRNEDGANAEHITIFVLCLGTGTGFLVYSWNSRLLFGSKTKRVKERFALIAFLAGTAVAPAAVLVSKTVNAEAFSEDVVTASKTLAAVSMLAVYVPFYVFYAWVQRTKLHLLHKKELLMKLATHLILVVAPIAAYLARENKLEGSWLIALASMTMQLLLLSFAGVLVKSMNAFLWLVFGFVFIVVPISYLAGAACTVRYFFGVDTFYWENFSRGNIFVAGILLFGVFQGCYVFIYRTRLKNVPFKTKVLYGTVFATCVQIPLSFSPFLLFAMSVDTATVIAVVSAGLAYALLFLAFTNMHSYWYKGAAGIHINKIASYLSGCLCVLPPVSLLIATALGAAFMNTLKQTDTCIYANDTVCDGPGHCLPGTDCTDCGTCDVGKDAFDFNLYDTDKHMENLRIVLAQLILGVITTLWLVGIDKRLALERKENAPARGTLCCFAAMLGTVFGIHLFYMDPKLVQFCILGSLEFLLPFLSIGILMLLPFDSKVNFVQYISCVVVCAPACIWASAQASILAGASPLSEDTKSFLDAVGLRGESGWGSFFFLLGIQTMAWFGYAESRIHGKIAKVSLAAVFEGFCAIPFAALSFTDAGSAVVEATRSLKGVTEVNKGAVSAIACMCILGVSFFGWIFAVQKVPTFSDSVQSLGLSRSIASRGQPCIYVIFFAVPCSIIPFCLFFQRETLLDVLLFSIMSTSWLFLFSELLCRYKLKSIFFGSCFAVVLCLSAYLSYICEENIIGSDGNDRKLARTLNGILLIYPIYNLFLSQENIQNGEKMAFISVCTVVAATLLLLQPSLFGNASLEGNTRQIALLFILPISGILSTVIGSSKPKFFPLRSFIALCVLYVPFAVALPLSYMQACTSNASASNVSSAAKRVCDSLPVWGALFPFVVLLATGIAHRRWTFRTIRAFHKLKHGVKFAHLEWLSNVLLLTLLLFSAWFALRKSLPDRSGIVLLPAYAGGLFWIFGNMANTRYAASHKKKLRRLKHIIFILLIASCVLVGFSVFKIQQDPGYSKWAMYAGSALAIAAVALGITWTVLFKFRDATELMMGAFASLFLSQMCCWLVLIPLGLVMPMVLSLDIINDQNNLKYFELSIPLCVFLFLVFIVGCTVAANRMFKGMEREKEAKRSAQNLRKLFKLLGLKTPPETLRYIVDFHHSALREQFEWDKSQNRQARGSSFHVLPIHIQSEDNVLPLEAWIQRCNSGDIIQAMEDGGSQKLVTKEELEHGTRFCDRCNNGNGERVRNEHGELLVPGAREMSYKAVGKPRGVVCLCKDCYTLSVYDKHVKAKREAIEFANASAEERMRILKQREDEKLEKNRKKQKLIQSANKHLQAGNTASAVTAFTCAMEFSPESANLLLLRSMAHIQAGSNEKALDDAKNASDCNGNLIRPLTLAAEIYEHMGEAQKRAEYLDQAVALYGQGGNAKGCKSVEVLKAMLADAVDAAALAAKDIEVAPPKSAVEILKALSVSVTKQCKSAFLSLALSPYYLLRSIFGCLTSSSKKVAAAAADHAHHIAEDAAELAHEVAHDLLDIPDRIETIRSAIYSTKKTSRHQNLELGADETNSMQSLDDEEKKQIIKEKSKRAIARWTSSETTIVAVRVVELEMPDLRDHYLEMLLRSDGTRSVSEAIALGSEVYAKCFYHKRQIGRGTPVETKQRHDFHSIGLNAGKPDMPHSKTNIVEFRDESFFVPLSNENARGVPFEIRILLSNTRRKEKYALEYVREDIQCLGSVVLSESALRAHAENKRCIDINVCALSQDSFMLGAGTLTVAFSTISFRSMLKVRTEQLAMRKIQKFARKMVLKKSKAIRKLQVERTLRELHAYYASCDCKTIRKHFLDGSKRRYKFRPRVKLDPLTQFINVDAFKGRKLRKEGLMLLFEDAHIQVDYKNFIRSDAEDDVISFDQMRDTIHDVSADAYKDIFPDAAFQFFLLRTAEQLPMYTFRANVIHAHRLKDAHLKKTKAELQRDALVHRAAKIIIKAIRRWRIRTNAELKAATKIQGWYRRFRLINMMYKTAKWLPVKIQCALTIQRAFRNYVVRKEADQTIANLRLLRRLEMIQQEREEAAQAEREAAEEERKRKLAREKAVQKFKKSKMLAIVNWMHHDDEEDDDDEEEEKEKDKEVEGLDLLGTKNDESMIRSVKAIVCRRLENRRPWRVVSEQIIESLDSTKPAQGPWGKLSQEQLHVDWSVFCNKMAVVAFIKEIYQYASLALGNSLFEEFSATNLLKETIKENVFSSNSSESLDLLDLVNRTSAGADILNTTMGAKIVNVLIAIPQFSFANLSFPFVLGVSVFISCIFPIIVQRGIRRAKKGLLGIDEKTHRVAAIWSQEGLYNALLLFIQDYCFFGVMLTLLATFACDYTNPQNLFLKRDPAVTCFDSVWGLHTFYMMLAFLSVICFYPMMTLLCPQFQLQNKALDVKMLPGFIILSQQAQLFVAGVAVFFADTDWTLVLLPEAFVLSALIVSAVLEPPCIIPTINKHRIGSLCASLWVVFCSIIHNFIRDRLPNAENGETGTKRRKSVMRIVAIAFVIAGWLAIAAKLFLMTNRKKRRAYLTR